jgi:hypothetical protein
MSITTVIKEHLLNSTPSFTQIQLSKMANVAPETFSTYMNNKVKFPKHKIALLLWNLKKHVSEERHKKLEISFSDFI